MATESLIIEVSEKGARVVKRNLTEIGTGASKASDAVDGLKRMLGTVAAGATIAMLAKMADAYTNIQNRLKLVTTGTANLAAVTDELFNISNRTRTSFEGTAQLYSRVAMSAKELGVSQQQLLQFTESLNQAVILSGASATEAENAIIQLSQGMASGTLRGDELRSVLEQLPYVADVIAKDLGVTRGELRKMGEDGKITGQAIVSAFQNARQELGENFAKTVPTLSQSFTVLKNKFLQWVGDVDKSYGITAGLSKLILLLADNLRIVGETAAVAGAVLLATIAGPKITAGLNAAAFAVRGLTIAIATNPIGALATLVLAAVAALTIFRDKINLGAGSMATLGDMMRAVWESAQRVFGFLAEVAGNVIGPLAAELAAFFKNFEFSFAGVMYAAAACFDYIVGGFTGAAFAVFAAWDSLPAVLGDLFTRAANFAIKKVEGLVNAVISGVNVLRDKAGLDAIADVALAQLSNSNAGAAGDLGAQVADAFAAGFEAAPSARKLVDDWVARADEISAARRAADKGAISTAAGPAASPKGAGDKDAAKRAKELRDAFDQLQQQIDPTGAAIKELAANERTLNLAQAAGLITATRKTELLELMKAQYRDTIDPLGAVNREMDQQLKLLQMTAKEEEVATQLESIKQQLLTAGIAMTEQQLAQMRERLELVQQETLLSDARRQLLDQVNGPAEKYNLTLAALNELLKSGMLNGQQFNQMLRDARIEFLESENTFAAGAERSLLKLQRDYSDVGGMVETTITNAFGNAEEAIYNFAKNGKMNFKEFALSLLADIGKLIFRLLILKPILDSIMAYFGGGTTAINYGGQNVAALSANMNGGGLPAYANGGISSGPQLAMVSEGRYKHEAHVPLPNGRSIPVEMNGGGGDANLNLTIEVYKGEGDGVSVKQNADAEGNKLKIIMGQVAADIAGGGELDRTIRQTYSLKRTPNG